MSVPTFTLSCVATDRSRPVASGEVVVEGCALDFRFGEPEAIFRDALNNRGSDITELSMASHIVTTARGDSSHVGVPVFLSRAYRHSAIFVRAGGAVNTLADLKGCRIGLPEYQQTAALWVRGMMLDAGVRAQDVHWHVGGLNEPGPGERIALTLPADIRVTTLQGDATLDAMLLSGELDAIISPRVPGSFARGDTRVRRLFTDLRSAETEYYRQTGFFPLMHCLAVRREVAEAHPWLAVSLFNAFAQAKRQRFTEMAQTNVLRVSLPWIQHEFTDTLNRTGGNPWPYGFACNRDEIAAMARYAFADGVASRLVAPEDLFDASTLGLTD
jgi:4,5-dihydroxyphthalate decarboxylase